MNKILLLSLLVLLGMAGMTASYISLRCRYSRLRTRAELLAFATTRNGKVLLLEPPPSPGNTLILHNVQVFNSPIPIRTITEWSTSGVVGEPTEAGSLQWSCPIPYKLKFDGGVPYCE